MNHHFLNLPLTEFTGSIKLRHYIGTCGKQFARVTTLNPSSAGLNLTTVAKLQSKRPLSRTLQKGLCLIVNHLVYYKNIFGCSSINTGHAIQYV